MTTTFKEIAESKIITITEKFILYIHDNFNPLQVSPFKPTSISRENRELGVYIRDDNIVFDEDTYHILGMWDNDTETIIEIPNYFVDTIQYIQFNFDYIMKKINIVYGKIIPDEREYLKYIINEEFNINDDIYNIYIRNILNTIRNANDEQYYGDVRLSQKVLLRRYHHNMCQYVTHVILTENNRNVINFINNMLENLNNNLSLK
jgi:hypothetical protein